MTTKAKQQSKPAADVDCTDLLTDDDLTAIEQFRERLKGTFYGGHEYCSIIVATYAGAISPDETEHQLLKLTFLSRQDRFIETVCRRVMDLAREIDPSVELSDDRCTGESVDRARDEQAAASAWGLGAGGCPR